MFQFEDEEDDEDEDYDEDEDEEDEEEEEDDKCLVWKLQLHQPFCTAADVFNVNINKINFWLCSTTVLFSCYNWVIVHEKIVNDKFPVNRGVKFIELNLYIATVCKWHCYCHQEWGWWYNMAMMVQYLSDWKFTEDPGYKFMYYIWKEIH